MTIETETPRWLTLDGAVNARVVVPGVLLRSDNLQDLSDRDLQTLVEQQQLAVVLDLRTEIEIASEGPGPMAGESRVRIDHHSLYPQMGNTDLDLDGETINPWGNLPGDDHDRDESPVVRAYLRYLRRRPDSVAESVKTIATTDGAVLVHCAAGKDRTGVVVALALDAVGVDRELIVSDYLATAERIEAIMERLLSSVTYRDELAGDDAQKHAPLPGTMERVLELIDEHYGGAAAFLKANGLSDDDLALLYRRINGSDRDDAVGAGQAP
jgi:protein-tyrosine phosphatase